MRRRRFLIVLTVGAILAGAAPTASAMFPASANASAGAMLGFPDVCKPAGSAVRALPSAKQVSSADRQLVTDRLEGIKKSVAFAEGFLKESKASKEDIAEARRTLDKVRTLVARAESVLASTPRDDKRGKLRESLLPTLTELESMPYPRLLRPAPAPKQPKR